MTTLSPVRRWLEAPVPAAAADLEREGFPGWLAVLLARRGVADRASADRFLSPSVDQLHDPYLLRGMAAAVERLLAARAGRERVAIVGDYDVDGVTSTALLLAVFRACGIEASAVLPHRMREGYGFQPVHVERARELACAVIVTADCGSSSAAAVEAAVQVGIDVIVTDHHLPGCELPAGAVQINPRQEGCSYPFRDLAAVGLSLKLALALAGRCQRAIDLDALLRIACLGTIADLVPLAGENRVIAALGLRALGNTRSQGLKALMLRAGVKPPFTAADVGFRLGPRLNAAGRLDDAARALELLLARDERRAGELADQLERWNRERQDEETRTVEEARRIFAARSPLPAILVAWSERWHKGVVGIAAGRLAKELGRPTILLAVAGETATGSGRSVPGIELHGFLERWRDRLVRFGGHAQAVGLSVASSELAALREGWEEAAGEWPAERLAPRLEYELHLPVREITPALLAELTRLEPFGQGNPQPLLRTGPLALDGAPRRFGNSHLSARARDEDGGAIDLVGWRWQEREADLGGRFEALGHLEMDSYRRAPVLRLADARPAAARD